MAAMLRIKVADYRKQEYAVGCEMKRSMGLLVERAAQPIWPVGTINFAYV
jgi:hypothetical protein